MRMAELSRESSVSVATIKYYQREGLLPPGELTSPNQAHYDEQHVRRLRLVRALLDVGGLSVAAAREVLAEIDEPTLSTHKILGLAQHALPANTAAPSDTERDWASARIEELFAERGWTVFPDSPVIATLVGVLCAYRQTGHEWALDALGTYAEAAERVADADVDAVARLDGTESVVEGAVVGTVLGDTLLATLRHLAHAEVSRRRFG